LIENATKSDFLDVLGYNMGMKAICREIFEMRFWRNLIVVLLGVGSYFVWANLTPILASIGWLFKLLRPFVWGFVFAFLLNGPMQFFQRRLFGSVKNEGRKKFYSIATTFVVTGGILVALLWLLVPQLGRSLSVLVSKVPEYTVNLESLAGGTLPELHWESVELNSWLGEVLSGSAGKLVDFSGKLAGGVVDAFLGLVVAAYFLFNQKTYWRQMGMVASAFLPPLVVERGREVVHYGSETFVNFFYAKILDSLIVGGLCFVGLLILQIPYALLISIVVGVTNIIPIFGPIVGTIPPALLILAVNPWQAVWFVIFIIVLQQFDGNILGPRLMSDSVGLPAFWVMFAILVGGGMFGMAGMILGIPVMAMIYQIFREIVKARLERREKANCGVSAAD
jgi:predicted PurR-regulated permease PerM